MVDCCMLHSYDQKLAQARRPPAVGCQLPKRMTRCPTSLAGAGHQESTLHEPLVPEAQSR